MTETPTLHELQLINSYLEDCLNYNLDGSADEIGLPALVEKLDKWLAWVAKTDNDPKATMKLAVETAEKAGPFEGMLALSTAHISKKTADWLGTGGDMPIVYYEHGEYGWLINVPQDESAWASLVVEATYDKIPGDLFKAIDRAHDCGCSWLLLDADAGIFPGLPTFKW